MPDEDTDTDRVERRLAAVERALTDGDETVASLSEASDLDRRLTAVEERLETLEAAAAEREAALQAVRGYVGGERSLDREVERTAESALATAKSLGERVDELERRLDGPTPSTSREPEARSMGFPEAPAAAGERGAATGTAVVPETDTESDSGQGWSLSWPESLRR